MSAASYVHILKQTLLPSVDILFRGDKYRFMRDNDLKHTSKRACAFFELNGVDWWRMPLESRDLNPIENLWHELKEFIRREVKPTTKAKLVDSIL